MSSYTYSVTEVNEQIKTLIETMFLDVNIEGEISNLTKHSSGHIYFSIKDEKSSLRCVMFKGNATSLAFELQDGQKVVVRGGLSVFVPRGEYQILCKSIEPSGEGALSLAYEQLKQKLQKKGYFDTSKKKKIPSFPKKIALITSSTGAAIKDMLKVAKNRWELTHMVVINTLVQGKEAKFDIAKNIQYADSFFGTNEAFDVIVIARGGGSREDLWAFNEEVVADSIYEARTPIISAVGHEIDYLISDLVADVRAPTPSACMEMILPDKQEWFLRIDEMMDTYNRRLEGILAIKEEYISSLTYSFKQVSYEVRFQRDINQIIELKNHFSQSIENLFYRKTLATDSIDFAPVIEYFFVKKNREISDLKLKLEAKNPKNFISSGYAQVLKDGKIVSLLALKKDEEIELIDTEVELKAKIL